MACAGRCLPVPVPRELDGVDAAAIAGFPVSTEPARIAFPPGMIRYALFRNTRYLIALEGPFEAYRQSKSRNSRQKLIQDVRRFHRFAGGDAGVREFEGASGIREFYAIASPLSRKTWQGKLGRGLDDLEPRSEICEMASAGRARGYILFCRDQPAAFLLCHVQESTLVASQIGYDPEFAEWLPGSTLFYLLLEKLFAEGKFTHFDLMEGTIWPYKARFATIERRSMRFLYFRRNLRSLSLVLSHYLLRRIERLAIRARDGLLTAWHRGSPRLKRRGKTATQPGTATDPD